MAREAEPRPFVTLEDIREWIAASTPADWGIEHPAAEPTFRLGSLLLQHPGPPPHEWRAVYLPRPSVRLLWGREHRRAYEPDWQPSRWGPSESKLAELFWKGLGESRGTSIEQYRFALVDRERCYLPVPKRAPLTKSGRPEPEPKWTITSYERALFRLLNGLSRTAASGVAFDEYLREAAIQVTD